MAHTAAEILCRDQFYGGQAGQRQTCRPGGASSTTTTNLSHQPHQPFLRNYFHQKLPISHKTQLPTTTSYQPFSSTTQNHHQQPFSSTENLINLIDHHHRPDFSFQHTEIIFVLSSRARSCMSPNTGLITAWNSCFQFWHIKRAGHELLKTNGYTLVHFQSW